MENQMYFIIGNDNNHDLVRGFIYTGTLDNTTEEITLSNELISEPTTTVPAQSEELLEISKAEYDAVVAYIETGYDHSVLLKQIIDYRTEVAFDGSN